MGNSSRGAEEKQELQGIVKVLWPPSDCMCQGQDTHGRQLQNMGQICKYLQNISVKGPLATFKLLLLQIINALLDKY